MPNGNEVILAIENLRTSFRTRYGHVKAVDGVSLELHKGETLGLVGESGSGKSVTNLSVLRLVQAPPGRIDGGSIKFRGRDLLNLGEKEVRTVRGHHGHAGQVGEPFRAGQGQLE